MTDDFSIDRTRDRAEIQHRIHQFCRAVDRLQFDHLRDVYHAGATHDHGIYKGDVPGWIEFTRKRHETIQYSSHHVSNILIDFVDADNAAVETYYIVWQSVTAQASMFPAESDDISDYEVVSSGRYVDHFVRADDRWAIMTRTVVPGSAMKVADPAPAMVPGFARQTRDGDDPVWALRARLGVV